MSAKKTYPFDNANASYNAIHLLHSKGYESSNVATKVALLLLPALSFLNNKIKNKKILIMK